MTFPSVEEVSQNPAFPMGHGSQEAPATPEWSPTRSRGTRGLLNISCEIYGEGLIKRIANWRPQTLYFGHERVDRYSVLIFDDRGAGVLNKPVLCYSTSFMARDLIEVLNHIGWTSERQLHVSGGMGGMIALEIPGLAPQRTASLNLHCTMAKLEKTIAAQREQPRCEVPADGYKKFESDHAHFAARETYMRWSENGFLLQAVAAGFHQKSPVQLDLADRVGRGRLMVLCGTAE
ncbi:alpha/beta-hydrolase [Jackrogersella minutella]|nr:alpha/beta-hydrolase [Jackrogersella minutella]